MGMRCSWLASRSGGRRRHHGLGAGAPLLLVLIAGGIALYGLLVDGCFGVTSRATRRLHGLQAGGARPDLRAQAPAVAYDAPQRNPGTRPMAFKERVFPACSRPAICTSATISARS